MVWMLRRPAPALGRLNQSGADVNRWQLQPLRPLGKRRPQVAGLASAGLTPQRSDAGYVRRGHAGTGNAPVHLTALLRPGLVPGGEHTYSGGRDVHTAATDTGEAARREEADVEQVVQCGD